MALTGEEVDHSKTPRERATEALELNSKRQAIRASEHSAGAASASSDPLSSLHLLLSGGGYRATLFHLGVLRFLYEFQRVGSTGSLLSEVNYLLGISGGSITASHFALHADEYCAYFSKQAQELIKLTKTVDLRRNLLIKSISVADSLTPWFPSDKTYAALPRKRSLRILSTDFTSGGCVSFDNNRIRHFVNSSSDERALTLRHEINRDDLQLRHGIAASAAFPPFFPPLSFSTQLFPPGIKQHELGDLAGHSLADGGIRDNLGIDFYLADTKDNPLPRQCIVSDAGLEFDLETSDGLLHQSIDSWAARLLRSIDIQMKRLGDLDLARMPSAIQIQLNASVNLNPTEDTAQRPFSQALTRQVAQKIAETPTDLCILTDAEAYAIVRLGYDLAAHSIGSAGQIIRRDAIPDEGFWRDLLPSDIQMLNADGDEHSLCHAIRGKLTPRIENGLDLINHLPIGPDLRRTLRLCYYFTQNRWVIVLSAIILFLFTVMMVLISK